jgi:hypothetical protein
LGGGGGVQTVSTRHVGHFRRVVPVPGDCEDGEFNGMKIGRGNRSTRRNPPPTPLCPPQIPLDQTRSRTRPTAVGTQRLTAWTMERPKNCYCIIIHYVHLLHVSIQLDHHQGIFFVKFTVCYWILFLCISNVDPYWQSLIWISLQYLCFVIFCGLVL